MEVIIIQSNAATVSAIDSFFEEAWIKVAVKQSLGLVKHGR